MRPINPKIYGRILYDKRLPYGAFRLWHLLADRAGKKRECWPSIRSIRKDLGCNYNSLKTWLKMLKQLGYLKILEGQRRTMYYPFDCRPCSKVDTIPCSKVDPGRVQKWTRSVFNTGALTKQYNQSKELTAVAASSGSADATAKLIADLRNSVDLP